MQNSMIATDVLAPSEVVLLNGDRFSTPDKNGFALLRGDAKVDSGALAVTALKVALLANEGAGTIRLEQGVEKKLFGLLKSKVLRVYPGAAAPEWPANSYEARIHDRVKASGAEGLTVKSLVYELFTEDVSSPSDLVAGSIAYNLVARGLAETETRETKTLGIFKSKTDVVRLNAAGSTLAERHPLAPVQELLSSCQRGRAELWGLIETGIRSGLVSRVESTRDYDHDSGSFD